MRCYLEDYSLLPSICCKTEATRSVVFDKTSYPPLILAFCSSVHRYGPLHIYPCICSVAPCLRVLWISTHGCCRCQNRRISGRGFRTVRQGRMVTGDKGHEVYPGSGPLDGGNTLLLLD